MTNRSLYPVWFVVTLVWTLPLLARESVESRPEMRFPFRGRALPETKLWEGRAPQVGLYVGKGVWSTGREHLKMFLSEKHHSYRTFSAKQVLDGELASSGVQVLIMPGGESWEYLAELGAEGADKIRAFVAKGGGYLGICAGAFYATSLRQGGHATGPYGIGLLEGTAYDGTALETKPFIEGMMDFPLLAGLLTAGLGEKLRIVLFGGPSFRYSVDEAKKKKIVVLSEFPEIREPAMITLGYGKGKVYLSGPHLEIEEDRTDWGADYHDPESDWPLLERVLETVAPSLVN